MRNVLFAFCLIASQGFAGTIISIDQLPANTEHGTYNGFVTATVNGVPGIQLICDDYYHSTVVPSGDLVYHESELVAFSPLQNVRFVTAGGPTSHDLALYMQAALIIEGITNTGPSHTPDLTADYQYALWHLFDSSVSLWRPAQQDILNQTAWQVQNNSSNYTDLYARLRIYTPTAAYGSNQEFLGLDAPIQSPEPASGALLGIAVGLFSLLAYRRRPRER